MRNKKIDTTACACACVIAGLCLGMVICWLLLFKEYASAVY